MLLTIVTVPSVVLVVVSVKVTVPVAPCPAVGVFVTLKFRATGSPDEISAVARKLTVGANGAMVKLVVAELEVKLLSPE